MEINSSGHRHGIWYNARFILGNETINKINIEEIELFPKHGIRFKNPGKEVAYIKECCWHDKKQVQYRQGYTYPKNQKILIRRMRLWVRFSVRIAEQKKPKSSQLINFRVDQGMKVVI